MKHGRWSTQGPVVSFRRTNALEIAISRDVGRKNDCNIERHERRSGNVRAFMWFFSGTWYILLLFKNSFSFFFIVGQIAEIVLYIRNVRGRTFWGGKKKEKELTIIFESSKSGVMNFGGLSYSSTGSSSREGERNTSQLFTIQLTSVGNALRNHLHCRRRHIPKRARLSKVNCGATYEL